MKSPEPRVQTEPDAPYAQGTILLLNDSMLAVYKRPVPEKEYHLVATLLPKGAVRIEGIALDGYQIEELGQIPYSLFEKLQGDMFWDRDLIVFHCYRFEDVALIPKTPGVPEPRPAPQGNGRPQAPARPQPSPPQPAAEPEKEQPFLARGKRLRVKFGDKYWDAVYWGRDEQGHVVAHQTHQQWALMHLDLDRFSEGLEVDPHVDVKIVEEINKSFATKQ